VGGAGGAAAITVSLDCIHVSGTSHADVTDFSPPLCPLRGGRISLRWVTQLSKIAVTQSQDQTQSMRKGLWAEGTQRSQVTPPPPPVSKQGRPEETKKPHFLFFKRTQKKGGKKRLLMNKDFRIFGYTRWGYLEKRGKAPHWHKGNFLRRSTREKSGHFRG